MVPRREPIQSRPVQRGLSTQRKRHAPISTQTDPGLGYRGSFTDPPPMESGRCRQIGLHYKGLYRHGTRWCCRTALERLDVLEMEGASFEYGRSSSRDAGIVLPKTG